MIFRQIHALGNIAELYGVGKVTIYKDFGILYTFVQINLRIHDTREYK